MKRLLCALLALLLAAAPVRAATLGTISFTTAGTQTATAVAGLGEIRAVTLLATCTVTSGGTTAKIYVQTSLDGGSVWYDIAQFAFTTSSAVKYSNIDGAAQIDAATPTSGTAGDDTQAHGLLGPTLRMVITTVGTYGAGSSCTVYYSTR